MNKKKEVKKLRKQIEKTLGWYLRNPDTTLGEAERACFRLHQAIEETYRNNFKDNGRPYSSKPIFVPSETKIDRQGTSQAVENKTNIDTSVPYEPWKKEDIENFFSKMMTQGNDKTN